LGKTLGTESGLLSNAYKYNPKALKEAQEAMLVRARPIGQDPYINMAESLRAKEAAGEPLKWYQKNLLNPQTNPDILAREKYHGQWFADNPSDLDFYINPATRNFANDAQIELLKARMPKSEAAKYNIKNFEDAKTLSNLHDSEYILPKDMVQQLERYPVDELPKLIKEYKQLNTPHWLKGYPESKISKLIPESIPGTTATGSGNLNAGISPQLIKNTIGTGNKVGANILNKAYISPFFSKAFNRYSPLNLIKGYGLKLEGAVKPLGNVLGKSIKNNKLTGSKPLFGKAKELSTQIGKTDASNIYATKFDDAVESSNIRLGEANPQGRFSRKSNATFPIQTKAGVNRYDLPISDPGVTLHRRLPFSNKYVPIDKQKLMNNKFQWSTTGAGLQNVAEKYGKGVVGSTLGYGAYNAYNFDKNKPETFATPEEIELVNEYNNGQFAESDVPSRAEMFKRGAKEAYESPLDYAKNPYFVNDIYQALKSAPEEKNGGSIESWEDDLDEEEIRLLKEAGFIVEELK
jgi:hypothetical protein